MSPVTESSSSIRRFGSYRLDGAAHRLERGDALVPLPPKAFELLVVLAASGSRLVRREELIAAVWPDVVVSDGSLDQAISALRRALGEEAGRLETVRGYGYRFRVDDVEAEGSLEPEAPPGVPDSSSVSRRARWALPAVLAAAILAVLVAVRSFPARSGVPARRRAVAVLGFRNLSGRAEVAWLSTGLREMLSADLAAGAHVKTVSGEEVERAARELRLFEGGELSKESLRAVRRRLGADLVASGSFAVLEDVHPRRLRFDVLLQEPEGGTTLATLTEVGTEDQLFDLVARAGERLRHETGAGRLSASEGARVRGTLPVDPEAARLYSEGLAALRRFEPLAARELMEKVVEKEPAFPPAHEALSELWASLGYEGRAREEAKTALDLSGARSREERLEAEGRWAERAKDGDRAVDVYRALHTFFPDELEYALKLADAESRFGRPDEARTTVAALRKLPRSDGDDARIDLLEGWIQRRLGDFGGQLASGRRAAEKGLALRAPLLVAQGRELEAYALMTTGKVEQAIAACQEGERLAVSAGNFALATSHRAICGYAELGRQDLDRAREDFEEGLRLARRIGFVSGRTALLQGLSHVAWSRGDAAGARRAVEEGLAAARESGNREQEGIALTSLALGDRLRGDLGAAERELGDALAIFRTVRLPLRVAGTRMHQAEVHRLRGELPEAEAAAREAARLFAPVGVARRPLTKARLARILLLEGKSAEAAALAREAGDEAAVTPEGEEAAALARAVLADLAFRSGHAADGLRDLTAVPEPKGDDLDARQARFLLALERARLEAASGGADRARREISALIAEARVGGLVTNELEARLALAQVDAAAGAPRARASLDALAADARARGYGLVAREATELRARL